MTTWLQLVLLPLWLGSGRNNQHLVTRASTGIIAVTRAKSEGVDRQDVCANFQVLDPIIKHLGFPSISGTFLFASQGDIFLNLMKAFLFDPNARSTNQFWPRIATRPGRFGRGSDDVSDLCSSQGASSSNSQHRGTH